MQSQYNYSFNNNSGTYQFTTKNNIIYNVAFIEDNTLTTVSSKGIKFNDVYQVVIEKVSDKLEPLDAQVYVTVNTIIKDFFSNIENALIYVCSDDNGKNQIRFRVFERWYQKSEYKNNVTKVDNVISIDDSIIYTSLLYHNENPNAKDILDTFEEIEATLNKDE